MEVIEIANELLNLVIADQVIDWSTLPDSLKGVEDALLLGALEVILDLAMVQVRPKEQPGVWVAGNRELIRDGVIDFRISCSPCTEDAKRNLEQLQHLPEHFSLPFTRDT